MWRYISVGFIFTFSPSYIFPCPFNPAQLFLRSPSFYLNPIPPHNTNTRFVFFGKEASGWVLGNDNCDVNINVNDQFCIAHHQKLPNVLSGLVPCEQEYLSLTPENIFGNVRILDPSWPKFLIGSGPPLTPSP